MPDDARPDAQPESRPGEDGDAARRQRARAEALVARSPVARRGETSLADGRCLRYASEAAFMPVRKGGIEAGGDELDAAVLTTAYCVEADEPPATPRPVCFAFNGGPGSASLWLHLGALGPKRLVVPDDGATPRPPFAVQDNPLTWLEHFDLVFVDPPHTGWSVAAGEAARKRVLSVDGDVQALVEVVVTWLTRHQRWGSAVYLAGESYGTTRGAAMADALQSAGVMLAGLVLVSCAMDLQSIVFAPRNDLPCALFLPAYAGVAQFHGCLRGSLAASPQAARQAAEAYVAETYLGALHAGARLEARARGRVARRLAELTGLPAAFVEARNLRISDHAYFVELLRERGRIVGRLDARVTGPMAASRDTEMPFDPGIEAIAAPYAMAAQAYFGQALGIEVDARYETLSMPAHKAWNWNRAEARGNAFASTSDDLSRALRRNPHLRVLVASGLYDLGTPYSASDWSLAQLDVPADVLGRVTHHHYDAGHMMYTRQADLERLAADLRAWLRPGAD